MSTFGLTRQEAYMTYNVQKRPSFSQKSPEHLEMIKITLLAIYGCLSSTITNLIEAFTIANLWNRTFSKKVLDLLETQVTTPYGKHVSCINCIEIHPHLSFEDTINADYLIIPALKPVPNSDTLREPKVLGYIRR